MPVIRTYFMGPTNYRPSRIKAAAHSYVRGQPVSVTLSWDHALNPSRNHLEAAEALARRQGWAGTWRSIEDADGSMLFVRDIEQRDAFAVEAEDA